jgi:hypothetical protein
MAADPPAPSGSSGPNFSRGGALVVGGGVAAVIGSLLPWAKASAPFLGTVSTAGTDGDGVITIVLGALVVVCGLFAWNPRIHKAAVLWAALASLVILGVSVYDISNVSDAVSVAETRSSLIHASVGIGLWLTAVGGAVGLLGALVKNQENVAARTRDAPAAG